MTDLAHQASLAITAVVLAGLWQGVLIAGVTWLVLRSLRGLGASTRYAIWLCALGALLVVPLGTVTLSAPPASQPLATAAARNGATPQFIPTGAVTASAHEDLPATPLRATPIRPPQSEPPRVVSSPAFASPNRPRIAIPESVATVVASLWLLLALARVVKLVLALRQLGAIRRSASLWSGTHEYPVLVSRRVGVPLAFGFLRPAVVLPASLPGELGAEALQTIIVHESAHLRRYDVWTNALARLAEALLALNPAAWFVMRRLSAEREIACDDCVVARTGSGKAFAHVLAGLATRVGPRAPIAAASATGTTRSTIVVRIEELLDGAPRQLRLSPAALGAAVASLAIVALVIESVSPVVAYASPRFTPAPAHGAAAAGRSACPGNHRGFPVSMLATPNAAVAKFGSSRVVPFAVTFDRRGTPRKVLVASAPSPALTERVKQKLRISRFEPLLRGCVPVAGTVRGAVVIGTAHTATLSIVEPVYPNGWSAQHPASCKVPNLLRTDDPSFPVSMDGIPVGAQYTSSARIEVDETGAVTNVALARSSGHRAFDDAVVAAARGATYPLTETTGFKPVRPPGTSLAWNAANGSSTYARCAPLPAVYLWHTTFSRNPLLVFATPYFIANAPHDSLR